MAKQVKEELERLLQVGFIAPYSSPVRSTSIPATAKVISPQGEVIPLASTSLIAESREGTPLSKWVTNLQPIPTPVATASIVPPVVSPFEEFQWTTPSGDDAAIALLAGSWPQASSLTPAKQISACAAFLQRVSNQLREAPQSSADAERIAELERQAESQAEALGALHTTIATLRGDLIQSDRRADAIRTSHVNCLSEVSGELLQLQATNGLANYLMQHPRDVTINV